MDPIIISVDERLAGAGSVLPVAGHIDDDSYSVGDHDFRLPGGIDYDLVLTNAGEGILASGIVRAHVLGTCDRCLEDAEFDIASEVDEYFLFEAPAEEAQRAAAILGEEMERAALRREYIDAVLGSLKGQLDNTYIVDAKGNKTKLKKKGE